VSLNQLSAAVAVAQLLWATLPFACCVQALAICARIAQHCPTLTYALRTLHIRSVVREVAAAEAAKL